MSFILDALKKSETERQEQSVSEFSSVPSSTGEASPLRWLWLLAALLLINVAVLVGILMKRGDSPASPTTAVTAAPADVAATVVAPPPTAKATQSFEERVANAVVERPPVSQVSQDLPQAVPQSVPQVIDAPASTSRAPTLDQLRLNGSISLPELHLDIHVFSDNPAERFVFINMSKYREGERLAAGPQVSEITPDGVILEDQGQAFLLPRE
ncbi:MAG: general secretion pathway protein GspB [Proteobacteria bacterium]|nr:general secretion pathway protein GspB [Pseudomonadota bacterium]